MTECDLELKNHRVLQTTHYQKSFSNEDFHGAEYKNL